MQATEEVLGILLDLLGQWLQMPLENDSTRRTSGLRQVEAAALGLMCSNSIQVRNLAIQLARRARELHLSAHTEQEPRAGSRHHRRICFLADILEECVGVGRAACAANEGRSGGPAGTLRWELRGAALSKMPAH